MPEHIPHYSQPVILSMTASAAVTGGQVVEITGNMTCGPAGAASTKAVGVAGRDAAVGAGVPVHTGAVHNLTASAAIAAGDLVVCAANGQVAPIGAGTFGQLVGRALEAIATAAKGRILLNLS